MYIPAWEPLADALIRVRATGLDEEKAKRQICQAIGDGAIGVRVRVADIDKEIPNRERSGPTVRPPSNLKPDDVDWQQSKPLHPWKTGPDPVERYSMIGGCSWDWALREIATVELFTDQVIRIFAPTVATPLPTQRLSEAPEKRIKELIAQVYDHAERQKMKPPNIREIARPVLVLLRGEGLKTSAARVSELAGQDEYKLRRRERGPRVRGTFHPFSLEGWKKSGAES